MENRIFLPEAEVNRKLLRLESVIAWLSTGAFFVMTLTAAYAEMNDVWRYTLIGGGIIIFIIGIGYALKLEAESGYYACPNCGYRWVPSFWSAAIAPHIGRSRLLTCPECGKKGMHKKVLTKEKA